MTFTHGHLPKQPALTDNVTLHEVFTLYPPLLMILVVQKSNYNPSEFEFESVQTVSNTEWLALCIWLGCTRISM